MKQVFGICICFWFLDFCLFFFTFFCVCEKAYLWISFSFLLHFFFFCCSMPLELDLVHFWISGQEYHIWHTHDFCVCSLRQKSGTLASVHLYCDERVQHVYDFSKSLLILKKETNKNNSNKNNLNLYFIMRFLMLNIFSWRSCFYHL